MAIAPFMILQGVHRFHKDGWHSSFAWIQVVCWSVIFTVWSLKLVESWHFEKDQLVMKRLLLPAITIPYANITSIDWTRSRNIVVTLSESSIVRGMKKRYVMVRDTPGFLGEMEHHVAPDILHI
jgi:hypothetical protein